MAATQDDATSLRAMLGEQIPPGGSAADTMFTDDQITAWLQGAKSLDEAALFGWRAKLATFAGMVNVTDGAASRELGMLFENAQRMVDMYSDIITGKASRPGRTRVGKIVRA